jgi:hypothetical protein
LGSTVVNKIYQGVVESYSGVITDIVMPTPSFGTDNLRMWLDTTKTWTDMLGSSQPSLYTDNIGFNSVSALIDLSGNGFSFTQGNKTNQPLIGGNGGVLFSPTNGFMECIRGDLMNGLSKFSIYTLVRPIAGTSKRSLLALSEGSANQTPLAFTIVNGGTLYSVGDYITLTGNSIIKVLAVDASGSVILGELIPVNTGTAPTDPVAQASASRPYGTSTGTGFTCNMVYTDKGTSSTTARFINFFSSGTTGRKNYTETSVKDGAVVLTSTTNGTSLGNPNNGALTDQTTFHRVGVEVDLTGSTASATFYKNNVVEGSVQTWTPAESTPWRLGNGNAIKTHLGNGITGALPSEPLLGELKAMILITDTLDTTRRNTIDNYLSGL